MKNQKRFNDEELANVSKEAYKSDIGSARLVCRRGDEEDEPKQYHTMSTSLDRPLHTMLMKLLNFL